MTARSLVRGRLILGSASPRRLDLMRQAGLDPDIVVAADIDETALAGETPGQLAARLALSKTRVLAARYPDDYVVAADTVVAVGRRILPKATSEEHARECLRVLSGRAHTVTTGVTVSAPGGRVASRLVSCRVSIKRFSRQETERYLASDEWRGKAGGYAIQGRAGAFVSGLKGSYTTVVGLPLFEFVQLLQGVGYPPLNRWVSSDG